MKCSFFRMFWLNLALLAIFSMAVNNAEANSQFNPSITLTYCVDPDWMPYEAINSGQHVGIASDYMKLIGKRANIDFQLIETESWAQSIEYLKNQQCDLASMLNRTPEREGYLAFSMPYFDSENVFVTRSDIPFVASYDSLRNKELGLVRNYRHQEYVDRHYPELNVTIVDSELDGLYSLALGEIDVMVGSMLSISTYMQKFGFQDLRVSGMAKPHDQLAIGVTKQHTDHLKRINQAILAIDETEQVELFRRWNQVTVIDQIDYRKFYGIAVIVIIVLALFFWRNYYMVRYNKMLLSKNHLLESLQAELLEKNKQLEVLSNRDALTSLHNRHYMILRCKKEIQALKRFSSSACLVLFDIDHFKQINDTHGHSLGDSILIQLSELVAEHIREIDVFARWGGEEFLILCPQTDMQSAEALAERIQTAIVNYQFDTIEKMTCSFGIAEYTKGETFIAWFDRADAAMYEAKEQGRNRIVLSTTAD